MIYQENIVDYFYKDVLLIDNMDGDALLSVRMVFNFM